MRKASRVISLLLALLLIGVGCIGAAAQEPAAPESEVIMQDNAVQEAAEQEAVELAAQVSNEMETTDRAATEEQELLNETLTENIPSESVETENTEEKTEEQSAVETPDEAENQEENKTTAEEPFTANISIELTNTGIIHLGDEVQLKAVVDGANRTYEVSWQNRAQPGPSDMDPDWVQVETGETYQLILTEEAAGLEYRVLLTADNDQNVASREYRLPEPAWNDETPEETKQDINTAPDEEEPQPSEETEQVAGTELPPENEDQGEPDDQADEEEMIVPEVSPENTDTSDEENSDLDLAWNEIVVVTEIAPETAEEPADSEQSGEKSEVLDDNSGELQVPDENGKESEAAAESDESQKPDENEKGQEVTEDNSESQEAPEDNSEEQEAPEKTDADLQAPPESGEEPVAPAEEEPQKERRIRILSTQGETVVCGETVRMMVDLSDFGDCSELSVIWEADKDGNWEEVGRGENLEYTATADSINWSIRARVRYLP